MPNRPPLLPALILTLALGVIVALTHSASPHVVATPNSFATPPAGATHYPINRQPRPALVGPASLYNTAHFLTHYSTEPANAPPSRAYVEHLGAAMEYAWDMQINRLGFAVPPADGGLGGDDRFDIYLIPISYYGYSDGAGGTIGDNPFTPAIETSAAFSFMALDTTFVGYADLGLTPLEALANTSAHEFNHSVQYGYDSNEELWLFESTAAVIESLQYPALHDNVGYLRAHADNPDACLPFVDTTLDLDYHPYSHWYFLKYLVENHPLGEKILSRIWEAARDKDGLFALAAGLDGQLDDYWSNWIIANLARQDCPAGSPYCMNEATHYPPVIIEGRLSPLNWDGTLTYTPPDGVGSFGVDYIDLTPFQASNVPLQLVFTGTTPGVPLTARLVGFHSRSPMPDLIPIPASGQITFDATHYARLYLTVENHTPALAADCAATEAYYTVTVTQP